jgi:hypothetical protein
LDKIQTECDALDGETQFQKAAAAAEDHKMEAGRLGDE